MKITITLTEELNKVGDKYLDSKDVALVLESVDDHTWLTLDDRAFTVETKELAIALQAMIASDREKRHNNCGLNCEYACKFTECTCVCKGENHGTRE